MARGKRNKMNYRSYYDMSLAIWQYIPRLPVAYDLIVGVPQSGMIPAVMLASYLKVRLSSLDLFVKGSCMTSGMTRTETRAIRGLDGIRNVLVVDDSVYGGGAMREARQRVAKAKALGKYDLHIDFAAVYSLPEKSKEVDFAFEVCQIPRTFQWNIFNQPRVTLNSCYDIDGVVCEDPTPEQNDDGPKYKKFLETASKRINIRFPIGAFVSSRLEKYRGETEEWLKNADFKWNDLVLLDLPTKADRIAKNAHAAFKAKVYKNRSETLFVESEWKQALEIARLSGKDVFCTETMSYINGSKGQKTSCVPTPAPLQKLLIEVAEKRQLESALNVSKNLVAALRKDIGKRAKLIESRDGQLTRCEAQLSSAREQIAKLYKLIKKRNGQLEQREVQLSAAREAIGKREALLKKRDGQLGRREEQLIAARAMVSRRDEWVAAEKAKVARAEEKLAVAQAKLEAANAQVVRRDKWLASEKAKMVRIEGKLAAAQSKVEAVQAMVTRRDQWVSKAKAERVKIEEQLASERKRAAKSETESRRKDVELKNLRQKAATLLKVRSVALGESISDGETIGI